MKKALLLVFTLAWWTVVLFSSGGGASGDWSRRLLHDLFGLTGQALDVTNFLFRKTGHVFYYFSLTGLLAGSLRAWLLDCRVRALVYGCLLAIGTGVFDEVRQSMSPGRTGTPLDLLYDGAGISLMAFLYLRKPARA